jgi:hypothetical protein
MPIDWLHAALEPGSAAITFSPDVFISQSVSQRDKKSAEAI